MLVLWLCCLLSGAGAAPLDPGRFLVWGPGLWANATLPVRYFFVQLVDVTGRNASQLQLDWHFWAGAPDGAAVLGHSEVLGLGDGLFVVRYRAWRSLAAVLLRLSCCGGRAVRGFPRRLRGGAVRPEDCACAPTLALAEWARRMGCSAAPPRRVARDMARFSAGIDAAQVAQDFERHVAAPQTVAACRYRVRQQGAAISRRCYGEHVGFREFSDELLLSLARKARLPDLDFIWNLGDWPLGRLATESGQVRPLPIVSWGGSNSSSDLLLPTYEIMEATLQMMDRVTVDVFSVLAAGADLPWSDRSEKLFWRGRDSHQQRLNLVRLAQRKPDLIDAHLTALFFSHNDSTLGQLAQHSSFFDFFRHKYQINIDGTVAAYRLPLLMAGGSVVLKQQSRYVEHFYDELQAGRHFLPVAADLTDLEAQLAWLKRRPTEAARMARAAREFVLARLTPLPLFCYHAHFFERLAAAQLRPSSTPDARDERLFERVLQPRPFADCACSDSGRSRDEL